MTPFRGRAPARRHLILGFLSLLALLPFLLWFGGRWVLSLSVADYGGLHEVAAISAPVEITFDAMGVPQVWAATEADLYFALGWLHASERLFQMELARRLSGGSLAELFGEDALAVDLRQRQLGFRRMAEEILPQLREGERTVLEAYVAGVNEQIESLRMLPPELVILRTRPRPWTVLDVLTLFAYQTWHPTELGGRAEVHAGLVERMGPEAAEMLAAHRPWSTSSVPEGEAEIGRVEAAGPGFPAFGRGVWRTPAAAGLDGLLERDAFPLRMMRATNNWALAPERSASGHALHAADPHLVVNQAPGFWYIVALHAEEGTEVVGITVPGVPVVAMGHNGRIAWSFSVAPLILADLYVERFHPEDSLRVRTPVGYSLVEVLHEEIAVRGEAEPRRVAVHRTPRGVLLEREGDTGRSVRWAGWDHFGVEAVAAAFGLPRVDGFDAFRRTIADLRVLSANWIYSDREGDIGYQLGPPVPRRSYNPYEPQEAADPEARWDGYHPLELRPAARNPAQGWLATTNNQPAPADWPIEIPGNYDLFRIARVEDWMSRRERFDRADMEAMQLDVVSAQALVRRHLIAEGAERIDRPGLADSLRAWDGSMAEDDALATLFAYWWRGMGRHLFEEELGELWPIAGVLRPLVLAETGAETEAGTEPGTEEGEPGASAPAIADASARALADALELWGGRSFGEVQTLTIRHPLSRAPLLDRWLRLDRGPFPRGGTSESLNLSGSLYLPGTDRFDVQVGPSMRYVLDWADVDGFTIEIPMGQSGNPFSPHYDDFLELNRRGERWIVPFTREAAEARAVSRLRLEPGG